MVHECFNFISKVSPANEKSLSTGAEDVNGVLNLMKMSLIKGNLCNWLRS